VSAGDTGAIVDAAGGDRLTDAAADVATAEADCGRFEPGHRHGRRQPALAVALTVPATHQMTLGADKATTPPALSAICGHVVSPHMTQSTTNRRPVIELVGLAIPATRSVSTTSFVKVTWLKVRKPQTNINL
jgi:hypothetical protein